MNILVTGGCGFIGTNLIHFLMDQTNGLVTNIDKLSYAAQSSGSWDSDRYQFVQLDLCEGRALAEVVQQTQPDIVFHLAAESHVDRSIAGPEIFVKSNVMGTFQLLEACRHYHGQLQADKAARFRFIHVSTDEVYGELNSDDHNKFSEQSRYLPNSPYSASKAASDHFVRAWHKTYGLPTIITHCSNNYGPYQHSEKLIPHMIDCALKGLPLPVYGQGLQIRDWLHVSDHVAGLWLAATRGAVGEEYNFGGDNEIQNVALVKKLCQILDEQRPQPSAYEEQIQFVEDRLGHDFRYAIDIEKVKRALNWRPQKAFDAGLKETVEWYLSRVLA